MAKSNKTLEDTRSLLSLPINRSKNFNYLMNGAKTTHIYANNNSQQNENTKYRKAYQNRHSISQRYNNLPILHNLNRVKYGSLSSNSLNFKSDIIIGNSNNLVSMRTKLIRYSITDSLKETSIIGSKIVDENLKIDDSDVNLDQNTLISTDSNEKMNEEEATTVTETLTPVIDSYSSDKVESLRSKTFFSQKKFCFKQIKLTSNNEIPTEYFLGCCTDIFSLFDNFGSSAFLPVKVDIYGNINKLKQKYSSDSKRYQTLQSIVQAEIDENTTNVKNSATDALLWLKRAIWFLKEFLYEFSNRDKPDLTECIYISYQKSLRQYHNWVVRSIFSIAVRSLPSTDLFMQGLCLEQQTYLLNKSEFERQVKQEMKLIFAAIDNILNIINEMYARKKLEK